MKLEYKIKQNKYNNKYILKRGCRVSQKSKSPIETLLLYIPMVVLLFCFPLPPPIFYDYIS